jgi:hypothetical protein
LAILAIKVYDVFLGYCDASGKIRNVAKGREVAKAIMEANEKFEVMGDTLKRIQS